MTELWPDFWTFVQAAWKRTKHNGKFLIGITFAQSILALFTSTLLMTTVKYVAVSYNLSNSFDVPTRSPATPFIIIGLSVLTLIVTGLITASLSLLYTLIIGQESKIHLKKLSVLSFKLLPVYLGNAIFISFIIIGNLGFFVIPGFILSILLQFVVYEYFIQGEPFDRSVSNSMSISSQHWGNLMLYSIPIGIFYLFLGYLFVEFLKTSLFALIPLPVATILRLIIQSVVSVMVINYLYELYLEARTRTVPNPRLSLVLPIFTAIVGWLILIFVVILPRFGSAQKSNSLPQASFPPFETPWLSPIPAVRTK